MGSDRPPSPLFVLVRRPRRYRRALRTSSERSGRDPSSNADDGSNAVGVEQVVAAEGFLRVGEGTGLRYSYEIAEKLGVAYTNGKRQITRGAASCGSSRSGGSL